MTELPRDESWIRSGTVATVGIANQDEVKLTFSLTMTAPEWRHLMRNLPSDGSAPGQLGKMIQEMLGASLGKVAQRYETTGYVAREVE